MCIGAGVADYKLRIDHNLFSGLQFALHNLVEIAHGIFGHLKQGLADQWFNATGP